MEVLEICIKKMVEKYHYPVMYREVLELLEIKNKKIVMDCTTGIGSHAYKFLEVMGTGAHLIGIDRDHDSLDVATQRLQSFEGRFTLIKENFINLDKTLNNLGIKSIDAFLFDLGISTYQLSNPKRGFSFQKDGPLDMRMDDDSFLSAYDLVNNLSEIELGNIFRKFGEERYCRRIARSLVEARRAEPISSTTQLAKIISDSVPLKARYQRIHPATRVFQSLRIAVNRELEILGPAISKAIPFLNKGGRIGVISFHSLEDRIVKHTFKEFSTQGILKIITKKPLLPADSETEENKPSRSAKLRVAEKI